MLALRVAESQYFAKSPLLSQFLLFICERMLAGSAEDLTEQTIGEHVFRRRPGYSTGEDNIVRTYALRLRNRLDRYFDGDGRDEPMRIRIPRGGYCPVFDENRIQPGISEPFAKKAGIPHRTVDSPEQPDIAQTGTAQSKSTGWKAPFSIHSLLLIGLSLLIGGFFGHLLTKPDIAPSVSRAHLLWTQLFNSQSNTYIVTTDNGLGVLQDITGRYATLNQYIDGSYFAQFDRTDTPEALKLQRLSRERLTSVPDSNSAASILLLPEARNKHVTLRNARTLQLADLKQSNLILLGSNYGDPWVSLFESSMNFQINYHATGDTYESEIINKSPRPNESAVYRNNSTEAPYATYAVIAFLPNLDRSGWVLIIEGLTMAGTDAATEFLFHGDVGSLMHDVTRGKQGIRPFEVLLKTKNLDSQASPPTILAERIY